MTATTVFIWLLLPFYIFSDETSKNGKPSWYDEEDLVWDSDERNDYLNLSPEEAEAYKYEPRGEDERYSHQSSQHHHDTQKQSNPDMPKSQLLQYNYEIQTLTGVSDNTLKHTSGTTMRAKISFFQANTQQCLMQFSDVKFGKLNRPIDNQKSSTNFDQFEPVNVDPKLIALLQLPIKFNCDKKQASFLICDGDDQPWSTNLKRGALDLLSPDFHQIFHTYGRPVNSLSLEENVEGKCVVEYQVEKNTKIKGNVYNVTKTIDHDTCVQKPEIRHNFRSLNKCGSENNAGNQEEMIKKSGSTTFVVAMSGNVPKIISSEAKNQYTLVLSSDKTNQLLTFVNQKIKLDREDSGKTVNDPKNPVKTKTGRIYSTEWDSSYEKLLMLGRQEHLKHASMYDTFGSIANALEQAFDHLLKNTPSKTSKSVDKIEAFLEAVMFLRLASLDDLKGLEKSLNLKPYQEGQKQSNEDQRQNTVNDQYAQTLGICGSKTCVQRLINLIQTNRISHTKAILALNEIRNAPVVSIEIIKEVVTLARSFQRQKSENNHRFTFYFLRQTLWLLSGSLVRDLCFSANMDKLSIRQEQDLPNICPSQFKKDFVALLVNNLKKSTEWQDQIIFTKALGNAGLLESIKDLKQIIHNKQKNKQFIRSSAIYALKKIAVLKPQYVESILKPLIGDDKEEQELRIASIHVLLSANPDKAFVDYLAEIQQKEPNPSSQVASYILSIFKKMSASSSHCSNKGKPHFAETLRSLKCQAQNLSIAGGFSFHCPAVGAGVDADFQLSYCNGPAESCDWPFHQVFDLSADWLGLQQKSLLTVGIVSLDGQELIQKTGQAFWHASKEKPKSMDDVWSHASGSTVSKSERITDFIFSIINYLRGVKKQDQKSSQQVPKAVIYLKFKDQNVGFLPISDKLIAQALPDFMPQIKRLENDLKTWLIFDLNKVSMLYDIHYKTATSAGIPVSVSFKQPVLFNFKGKVHWEKERSSPLAYTSQLDSLMSARMSTVIDMQTWTPVVTNGMKYETSLNLDQAFKGQLNGALKAKRQIMKITLPKPEDGANILKLESKTTSYNILWSEYIKKLSGKEDKPLISKNQMTTKHCTEEPITGSTFCVKTSNQPEFGRYDIFRPKNLAVWIEAGQLQNYPVEIEIATEHQKHRSPSNAFNSDNHVIVNNVKIRSKSNARQATFNFVQMKDPANDYFQTKGVFAKQWKSDTKEPLLMCFNAEKQTLPENYDKTQKNVFQMSLNWGASTCQSSRYVALKVLNTERQGKKPKPNSCTRDSCNLGDYNEPLSTFIVDINYQKVPTHIKNVTNKLYRSLKHAFYAKTDVAQIDVKNPAGKIWSKIAIPSDTCGQEADIILKIPGENVTFHTVAIPSWIFRPFKIGRENKNLRPLPSQHSSEDTKFGESDNFDDTDDSDELESAWTWLQHKSHKQPAKRETESHHHDKTKTYRDDDDVLRYDNPSEGLEEEFQMWQRKDERKTSRNKENMWKSEANQPDWKHDWEGDDVMNSFNVENQKQPKSKRFPTEKLERIHWPSDDTFRSKTRKTCHIRPNSVETFETVSYKFDLPECYTVLSKDCSKNGQYVVMTKKNDKIQKFNELFIVTAQHKILLKVDQNGKEQKYKLLIDDVEQTLDNNAETLARGSRDIRLIKHGNHVDVHLTQMQIYIEFEPSLVTLEMPEKATRNQCGLCGQSQTQDSSHKRWPTASDENLQKYIVDKYVVKSRDCKINQPNDQSGNQQKKPLKSNVEFDPNIDVSAVHHGNHPYFDWDTDNSNYKSYDEYHDDVEDQFDENMFNEYRKWSSDEENDEYEKLKFF